MDVLRWVALCLTWIMLAEVTSTLTPVDLVDMDWNFPLSLLGLILSPAGTDWTSWDLDLGFLALLALVPKYPNFGPPHVLGSPLISCWNFEEPSQPSQSFLR